jgi:myosin-crossreactive antigen
LDPWLVLVSKEDSSCQCDKDVVANSRPLSMVSEEGLSPALCGPGERTSTVIIGAGIIGCATAYYLANSGNTCPDTIHLVEVSPELFASASGHAGGFLAEDCTRSSAGGSS